MRGRFAPFLFLAYIALFLVGYVISPQRLIPGPRVALQKLAGY